jgi:2-C-methyl-D-erythritol 4-phosphate cytidylyltransferase
MQNFVIITAGGTGVRMGTSLPKQFIKISGKPILMHTFDRFYEYDKDLKFILSLPELFISEWKQLCNAYRFSIQHEIVSGGATRFHSVKNALELLSGTGFVAIHDGVRPLVSNDTIRNAFQTAYQYGNAVVSRSINFSLRMLDEDGNTSVDRTKFREIQTPQVFQTEIIKKAYNRHYSPLFTDDASVVENLGVSINLCEGNTENIKITDPADLPVAEFLLNNYKYEE